MSSHIQQGMDGREVKGREVWGNSYPQRVPLQQAPLGASTKLGSDHDGRPYISRFSIYTTVPPATDPQRVLPRADDVSTILRMLSEPRTSAVILSGEPGAGKSTLAALVYHHLQSVQDASNRAAVSAIRHFIWLSLSPNATLPDVIAAILSGVDRYPADFFL